MSTPLLNQLIDGPPSVFSIQFKNWANSLCLELEEYLLRRPINYTNYYVHSTGSISGTGSQWDPISVSGIPSKLGNNTRFWFAAGDNLVFHSGISLIGYSNVVVDAYGDISRLGKPRLHNFTTQLNQSSGWFQYAAGGPNVYAITGVYPTRIGMIREYGSNAKKFTPPQYLTTLTAVSGSIRSWLWSAASGGALFVNFGVNPNTLNFEICPETPQDGFKINGNGSYVRNIIVDGMGCMSSSAGDSYGFRSTAVGTSINGFFNCEAYFNGRHNIGHTADNPSSGIVFFQDCTTGYCNNIAAGGANEYVSYSPAGANVGVYHRCKSIFGDCPTAANIPNSGQAGGASSFYAHTNGSTNVARLLLWNECAGLDSGIPGAVPPNGNVTAANLPGSTGNFLSARSFVVDHVVNHSGASVYGLPGNLHYINPYYKFVARGNDTTLLSSFSNLAGLYINPIFDIVDIRTSVGSRPLFSYNVTQSNAIIYNGHIQYAGSGAGSAVISWDDLGDIGSGLRMTNTILSNVGAKTMLVGGINNATNLLNNAFYRVIPTGTFLSPSGTEPGYDDPSCLSITLSTQPTLLNMPTSGSILYSSGTVSAYGFNLEYDFNWRKRSPNFMTIGPFQEEYKYTTSTVDVVKQAKTGETVAVIRGKVAQGGINYGTKQPYSKKDNYNGLENKLTNRFDESP